MMYKDNVLKNDYIVENDVCIVWKLRGTSFEIIQLKDTKEIAWRCGDDGVMSMYDPIAWNAVNYHMNYAFVSSGGNCVKMVNREIMDTAFIHLDTKGDIIGINYVNDCLPECEIFSVYHDCVRLTDNRYMMFKKEGK